MMQHWFWRLAALVALALPLGTLYAAQQTVVLQPGDTVDATCSTQMSGSFDQHAAHLACATVTPGAQATNTPVAAATNTPMVMATNTPGAATGWHPPGTHDGLNVHEHGDQPPSWVVNSAQKPFTQTRESHTGYKGALADDKGGKGVQSYLITHILSTEMARSHGDHDYQLWIRGAQGETVFEQGLLDFSGDPNNIKAPIIERTSDNGQRPIALSTDGQGHENACEVWYSRPGALVFDLGWVICGRYQKFDGTVTGGTGTFRSYDWSVLADRMRAKGGTWNTLANYCTVEFGICRLFFQVNGHQLPNQGVVPIN